MAELATAIRRGREALKLSQLALADAVTLNTAPDGVTRVAMRTDIARLESGLAERTIAVLTRLLGERVKASVDGGELDAEAAAALHALPNLRSRAELDEQLAALKTPTTKEQP